MKVYMVVYEECDVHINQKLFSDKPKAEEYCKLENKNKQIEDYPGDSIEEWDVE